MPVSASDVISKIVLLFLVFIGVLGMFGKLRAPRIVRRAQDRLSSAKCPRCGKYTFGKSCDCKGRG
ncbi:hypothetical protein [Salibaculum griseiflavum]|uniref:Uncharacterized protein n=1 Tax=Salibaculum griseiflavum TaxID=1914409 RepID=A0A2V1P5Q7_9RHOB|nr:hypothetical protein [Salibaculum griseiflavum]PWG16552.1 hypothetical protein DFK10_11340 [Salibaculum griseiflavum]